MATEKIRINGQWVIPVVKTKGGGGGSDIEVVQETGQSTTSVMSQKAVTDALSELSDSIPEIPEDITGVWTVDSTMYIATLPDGDEVVYPND